MAKTRYGCIAAALFILPVLITLPGPAGAAGPEDTAAGAPWPACTPEEVGMSSGALADMLEKIQQEDLQVHSIVIVKDDRLVLDAYVHPYGRDTLHNVKSVSKSIISALVGIALREGLIGSLDETVHSYLPEYITDDMDRRKQEINLRHLLTMTSGLDLDENGPISSRIFGTLDWLKATYQRPMRDDPGTRFLYSTPLTHTMSVILSRQSGMSLHEFADIYLLGPLGFGEVEWRTGPQGYNFGGAELFLRPLDMARFGYLFLKGGVWEGSRVVPADWVVESTTDKVAGLEDALPYGYWWWLGSGGWYYASGWGGQSIGINPDLGFVIATTSADPEVARRLYEEYVLPWLDTEGAPAPDPENLERLRRAVDALAHPEPAVPDVMPATAGEISGSKYLVQWNRLGIESFVLDFAGDSTCVLRLATTAGGFDLVTGLDGVYRLTDTGTWGAMPGGNTRACRGRWVDDNTFRLRSVEMGNPVYMEHDFTFDGDQVEVSVTMMPRGMEFSFGGKAE
jgi:CubicO group peptidase (beta-lactamase class C family)